MMKKIIVTISLILMSIMNCANYDEPEIVLVAHNHPILNGAVAVTIYPYIYINNKEPNRDSYIVHETVHFHQQRSDDSWFAKYAFDKEFRLDQEVEAYVEQIRYDFNNFHETIDESKYMHLHYCLIKKYSNTLSSDVYDNLCTKQEAKNLIEKELRKYYSFLQ